MFLLGPFGKRCGGIVGHARPGIVLEISTVCVSEVELFSPGVLCTQSRKLRLALLMKPHGATGAAKHAPRCAR